MTDSQKTTRVGSRNEDSEAIVALSFLYIVCDDRSSNSKSRKLVVVVVGVDVDLGWRWVGGVVSGLGATSEFGGENVRGWAAVKVPPVAEALRSGWGCARDQNGVGVDHTLAYYGTIIELFLYLSMI